jgi:Holliday junction DNA helicase RuvA
MFNSISGILTAKHSDSVYVLTSGLEWDLSMCTLDIGLLPSSGSEVRLFVWLYHREDLMRLYAFPSEERRRTFLELQKVEGIGPKAALKIMGGIGQAELLGALETGDLARLEAVPGLGKKTAQKMILALKGRLVQHDEAKVSETSVHPDLVEALVQMGYEKKTALKAVEQANVIKEREISGLSHSEAEKILFKEAIILLSSGA